MTEVAREKQERGIQRRMMIIAGVLAAGFGTMVAAAWNLMVVDGPAWSEVAAEQRARRLLFEPKRGNIYDRNGTALAVSVETPSVSLDAVELLRGVEGSEVAVRARAVGAQLAAVLSLDPVAVERKILSGRRFQWLKRGISAEEAEQIRRLSHGEGGVPRLGGLRVEGEPRRYYARRELAGPLLGFVSADGLGRDGLEFGLDRFLQGHPEELRGLRDRAGRLILAEGVQDPQALAGQDIELTIDQGLQYVAEQELASAVRTFEAAGGSVVVMDPQTGEILALASWPGYNPNDYRLSLPEERRNQAISNVYEPGSTMKMFTVSAALAAGVVQPTQQLYCEKGRLRIDNVTIRDTHPAEWLSIGQILQVSSNICSAKIGLSLGGDRLYEALRRFGFGQATGLPLPGEAGGTLRPRGRDWVQVETASAAFGQGIGVTAVQLAAATSVIANGGMLMEAKLVRTVRSPSGEILRDWAPTERRRVIPTWVARTMRELLVSVTEGDGTGLEAAIPGYRVAGKTATAQKSEAGSGAYSEDKFVASFIGMVPAANPRFVIAVAVDEPMVDHAGGNVAAPVFRRVGQFALSYYGVTPLGTEAAEPSVLARAADPAQLTMELWRDAEGRRPGVQETLVTQAPRPGQVRVPDMTGWPIRAVLRQAKELGVEPAVEGAGLLVQQVPPPGSVMDKGAQLKLRFEPAS